MPWQQNPRIRFTAIALAIVSVLAVTLAAGAAPATRLKPLPSTKAGQGPIAEPGKTSQAPQGSGKEGIPDKAEVAEVPLGKHYDGMPPVVGSLAPEVLSTTLAVEVEPNGTSATATPIPGASARIRGFVNPNGDLDFFSFTAAAGDRVYAATMTSQSANGSVDSTLTLFSTDGVTVLENDADDGSMGASSSSIAGRTVPAAGTYFLRVQHALATNQLRPYHLHFRLQSGSPVAEVESNDTTATAQPLPASGWVTGSTSSTADLDFYSVTLAAGDTVYLGLDLDPERDTSEWNGQVGLGQFGTPPLTLVVNDTGTATPDSEAFFLTARTSGTYFVFVGLPTGGVTFGTYHLSVTVFPRTSPGSCTTYTSTNVPVAIPSGPGIVTSTLTVPGNPTIDKLRVNVDLTHNFMADLDVQLTTPNGTTIGLFSDIGSVTAGANTTMALTFDDDAGCPPLFVIVQGMSYTPELNYRLAWLDGMNAGGTWTMTIRDDAAGDAGTLNGWSLEICEDNPPLCAGAPTTVFGTDFEANNGGFTHSGTQDEWEYGLPTAAPINTANSGVNCWKTDLDSTYNNSSNQTLLSPVIALPATTPLRLSWAQKYQLESASFDQLFVEVREVGGGGMIRRVFEHQEADMIDNVGNPIVTVQEASGWGVKQADISAFAGLNVQVAFVVVSDTTVQRAGLAIDDFLIEACGMPCMVTCPSNVTVSNDPNQCGAVVTYPAPMTTGDCGTIICSPASGSFFPVGTTTVTCQEDSGMTSPEGTPSCTFTVTVNDTQLPTLTCPANITQSNDPNPCGAVVTYTTPTIVDNCPVTATVMCMPASGSFFPVGTTTVTCNEVFSSAESGLTCSFTVTVNDTQSPTITCPANITQANDANQCGAVVNFASPSASDNCPGVTTACSPASGSFFPVGTTTVTCTATDAATNTATCSFTVTINDAQPPTITCPANVTVPNDPNQCGATVNYAPPAVSDNCPGVTAPVCSPASGSFFPVGTTTVSCSAMDAATNTATCSFTVTINDAQPPTITCPANITATGTAVPGSCGFTAVVTYAPSASDNCPGVTSVCVPASGSTFNEGVTTVTCTATDAVGNMASCSFTVTVGSDFDFCAFGNNGDSFHIVTDLASPSYGYWRYHIAATNTTLCGTANFIHHVAGIKLRAYDNNYSAENPVYFMDASFNATTGTVYIRLKSGQVVAFLRDYSLLNNPPCN